MNVKISKWNLYLSGIFILCHRHCRRSTPGTAHNAVFNSFGSAVCKKLGTLSHMAAVYKPVSAVYQRCSPQKTNDKKSKKKYACDTWHYIYHWYYFFTRIC